MSKIVERIEVETFSHATESLEKVMDALTGSGVPKELISVHETYGHYGNRIYVVRASIKQQRAIRAFINSPFMDSVKDAILDTLPSRLDEKGMLHFRVDKQDLYNNVYRLYDRGDVRYIVKILSYPLRMEKVMENAKELLGS